MNTLLIYMIKVAVFLAAFYLVYSLMLSRDTLYGRNRAFLLLSLASSIIFPLINFQTGKPHDIQFFGKLLEEVFITDTPAEVVNSLPGSATSGSLHFIYSAYLMGVGIFLLKLVIDLFNLLFLIFRGRKTGSRIIRFNGFNTSGFSAMGYIFISTKLNQEEAGEIIKHEQNHLRQYHFIDIIFIEIVKAFQWFNPIVYLTDRALRAIHEFQADQDCLNSGVPVANYQCLLLNQVFKSRSFNLTNSFSNPSLVRKRMIMMTRERTSAIARMKLLLVIPVTAIVFLAISAYNEIPEEYSEQQSVPVTNIQTSSVLLSESPSAPKVTDGISSSESQTTTLNSNIVKPSSDQVINSEAPLSRTATMPAIKQSTAEEADTKVSTFPEAPPSGAANSPDKKQSIVQEADTDTQPFVVVEEMPTYPGGDIGLLKYIAENTNYPLSAKQNNLQGKVIVRFCVTTKGGVSQASILKGVSPELDEEALRVVNSLQGFRPGKQGGKVVPVWYMVPITFTLK